MTVTFRLNVFGAPELSSGDGKPIRLRTRKQLALLVYLVLEARDRPVSRERLLDLMWPGVPPKLARHSLSQAFTAIRAHLGTDAVVSSGDDVRLRAQVRTDLDELSNGGGATEVPADPLAGLDLLGGLAFSHWVDGARARVSQATRDALLDQVMKLRAGGEIARVYEQAAVLYALDPMCEAAVHALAERALLRGDGVAAIRLLRQHLDRSTTELRCTPPPDLIRLLRRLEAGAYPSVPQSLESRVAQRRPVREAPFVGRVEEMSELEGVWARAREGKLETVLVTGPAGMGKSALLTRFTTGVAARANPVFLVACQEIGAGIPFAAVTDLMLALRRDPALGGTDPLWLAEASRVCPALRTSYPGIPDPPAAPGESVRVRIAEAAFRMLEAVADGGPLLLVFDDAQHMDPASRDALHVVARRLENTPAMILAAARAEDGSDPMRDLFSVVEPERLAWGNRLRVSPLARSESHQLVDLLSAEVATPVIREKIEMLGQGNPYFIEMLVADWQRHATESLAAAEALGDGTGASWRPPETLRLAFAREYEGLSIEARDLIHLLAVARRAMGVPELISLLGVSETDVDHAALELCDRALVRVDEGKLAFKNEMHRAFVYYAMTDDSRKYHHRRIARMLVGIAGESGFQQLLEAAHHSLSSSMSTEALALASRGARLALDRGAPREAEKALQAIQSRGIDLPVETCLLLAQSMAHQSKNGEALACLARILGQKGHTLSQRAKTLQIRAEVILWGRLGDEATIEAAALESLLVARSSGEELLLLPALQTCAEVAAETGKWRQLAKLGAEASAIAGRSKEDDVRAQGDLTFGFCLYASGQFAEAYRRFLRSVIIFERRRIQPQLARALNGCGVAACAAGEMSTAILAWERCLKLAEGVGDFAAASKVADNIATTLTDLGEFCAAEAMFERALDYDQRANGSLYSYVLSLNVADLRLIGGDLRSASDFVTRAENASLHHGLRTARFEPFLYRGDLCIVEGRTEEALQHVERALDLVGTRVDLVREIARFDRLRRYRLLVLGKPDAAALQCTESVSPNALTGMAADTELALFTAWLDEARGRNPVLPEVRMWESAGLLGVAARLKAVRMYPDKAVAGAEPI